MGFNLSLTGEYHSIRAYSQSKLANLLFTLELQRRVTVSGSPVRALAAHPGWAATNLQSHDPSLQPVCGAPDRQCNDSARVRRPASRSGRHVTGLMRQWYRTVGLIFREANGGRGSNGM